MRGPETFPFWTEHQAELGLIRIGLTESFLETLEDDLVGLEWTVFSGHARKADTLGLLHTSRRSIDLRAPFAMEVLEVNSEVLQDPRLVRDSPYCDGWLAEVRRHD